MGRGEGSPPPRFAWADGGGVTQAKGVQKRSSSRVTGGYDGVLGFDGFSEQVGPEHGSLIGSVGDDWAESAPVVLCEAVRL